MSQRLLFSALFLSVFLSLLCCAISEATDGAAPAPQSVKIFSPGKTTVTDESGKSSEINFFSFYKPFLVATNNALIAVAGGMIENDRIWKSSEKLDILTKYIATTENGWVTNFMNASSWKTEYAPQKIFGKEINGKIIAATTNENKIYILVVNNSAQSEDPRKSKQRKWEFVFVEGEVESEEQISPKIAWNITSLTNLFTKSQFKEDIIKNPLFISAFVSLKGKAVFFVKQEIQTNKNIFGVIRIKGSDATLEMLPVKDDSNDCSLYSFLWEEKVIMIPNNCNENQEIQKFDYTEDKLIESNESIGQVWEFLKNKKNITTAKINNTPVVLFTEEKNNQGKNDIYLWITDGSRLANVEILFAEDKMGFYKSFVYAQNHLFVLHRKDENRFINYYITHLSKEMGNITFVLNVWNRSNEKVTQLCRKSDSIKTSCSTDGLVAFLSNKSRDGKLWEDEYVYVNATVKEGTKVEDGFQFDKRGAGALWPVGEDDKNQQYNFADFGFTLVVTVTVGSGTRGGDNSLLGVKNGDSTKSVGVWCLSEGVFAVSANEKRELTLFPNECVVNNEYEVALVHSDNKLFAYVDWERLGDNQTFEISKNPANKLQFYFGADGPQQTSVNVTNVLLYNRPFTKEEIENLKVKQDAKKAKIQADLKVNTTEQQTIVENTSPTEKEEKEQSSSPPPTTEDSAVRVGVVGVLCFMLFGVFTLSGRYVY